MSGLALVATAGAQSVIGSFQGSSDGNNGAYWQDGWEGVAIASSTNISFPQNVVSGYAYSLEYNPHGNTAFGDPNIQVSLSAAQIAALNSGSYLTFTFSVPTAGDTASGTGFQLYNMYVQEGAGGGYGGYHNLISPSGGTTSWSALNTAGAIMFEPTTAGDIYSTNNNQNGQPNFYFYSGEESLFSEVVTINYSSLLTSDSDLEGDTTNGLIIGFQFNQSVGTPMYLNNVVISSGPFGQNAGAPAGEFIVDNFSANGVGPSNPTNEDYFPTNQVYANGQITNVWVDFFGIPATNSWAQGVSPGYAPTAGSLELQWVWNGTLAQYANQMVVWENGANYGLPASVGEPVYTNFSCDIMFPSGATVGSDGTFGAIQFGSYSPNGNGNQGGGQDYFGGANNYVAVAGTNAGVWQHVSIALNANDAAETEGNIGSVVIHGQSGYTASTINGPTTMYIDNVEFSGPSGVVTIPPPTIQMSKTIPALRIFAGSTANTYDRESLVTEDTSQSWINGHYPVSYSFSLLENIPVNIGQTMLELIPTASETPGNTTYNNEYVDYQSSNGLWLVLAPYNASEVVATVEWKTNYPNQNPNQTALTLTNSTIGTWTLTFTGPQAGTLTPPGGSPVGFSIADNTASTDFANPVVANFGLQPNSTAGEGEYEDWGSIKVSGVTGVNESENFTQGTNEMSNGTTPDGAFATSDSAQASSLVLVRSGMDLYWLNWGLPASGYTLVAGTNLLTSPTNWIAPEYFGGYIDQSSPPYSVPAQEGGANWVLLPNYDLPTSSGSYQPNAPAMNLPLAPNAFFILSTNTPNSEPLL